MPVVPPLSPERAPAAVQKLYEQVKQTLGLERVPAGYQVMGQVEPFLDDCHENYRANIKADKGVLGARERQAVVLATSSAMNCAACVRYHARMALKAGFSEQQIAEVLAVTASCTMSNVYYKFQELASDDAFRALSAELKTRTLKENGLGREVTELICVVVSNLNGCQECTAEHISSALGAGLTHQQVHEAVLVSATMAAFNTFHRTQ